MSQTYPLQEPIKNAIESDPEVFKQIREIEDKVDEVRHDLFRINDAALSPRLRSTCTKALQCLFEAARILSTMR